MSAEPTEVQQVVKKRGPEAEKSEMTLHTGQMRSLIAAVLAAATAPQGSSPADIVGHYRLVRAELGTQKRPK